MKKFNIPPVYLMASLILIVFFSIALPELNYFPFPFNYAGLFISFGGFILMGKTRDLLSKYDTTVQIETSNALITEGVFSKSRNPMYCGMFLFLLGFGIAFRNVFSMLMPFVFLTLINYLFIPKEEKLLEEKFGEEYSQYKNSVRKWI